MISLLILLSFQAFAVRRLLTYLHVYQQEDYNPRRFARWAIKGFNFDKRLSLAVILLSGVQLFVDSQIWSLGLAICFSLFAFFEKNPVRSAKKPLVLTKRAKRLLICSFLLVFVLTGLLSALNTIIILWLLPIQLIPFTLAVSTILLQPYEAKINKSFRDEAVAKLDQINPFVIGVTGSFGKTSVKHILGHILQNYAGTLMTPGSVNTEMGIVRIIREQLTTRHKYFIVEMGAYGIGSIAKLCKLTPPNLSIISAVGAMHFERFKSLEGTARAKFEIAEAALAQQGNVIIHDSVLETSYAKEFYGKHKDSILTCGLHGDLQVLDSKLTKEGLEITIKWQDGTHLIKAPLYGLHHVGNIILCFATAVQLGMPVEDVLLSLQSLPQIKHRLEVKWSDNGTIIDDAFNSNPAGFSSALEVLDLLGRNQGRRILVTPGMVELGDKHDAEHTTLGRIAAEKADVAIVVMPQRIPTFTQAFQSHKNEQQTLISVDTFKQANEWLKDHQKQGDVVLLENDLPDIYENRLAI